LCLVNPAQAACPPRRAGAPVEDSLPV
jgi:hypothetical protein